MLSAKFGLREWHDEDSDLIENVFDLMQRAEVDMTEFFRRLADIDGQDAQLETLRSAFYQTHLYESHSTLFKQWLVRYATRLALQQDEDGERRTRMNRVNPRFVLRNYLAQQAIDAATNGDASMITRLMDAARHPYDENQPLDLIGLRPDWAINKPGCSKLSCSS
jgi:uncharacterized protein YdiU (UPF0061 family)